MINPSCLLQKSYFASKSSSLLDKDTCCYIRLLAKPPVLPKAYTHCRYCKEVQDPLLPYLLSPITPLHIDPYSFLLFVSISRAFP